MRNFKSLVHFSSYYNDDVWGKIFRFNKCVKAFKYISYNSSTFLKRKFQRKFQINSNYYFNRIRISGSSLALRRKTNSFSQRLRERHILQYFYGKLNKRKFIKLFLTNSKGKSTSYSRVNYIFTKLEFRIDVCLFRAGWFTDTIVPCQLVSHGFVSINGYINFNPFAVLRVGDFLTLSKFVFNIFDLIRRIRIRRYLVTNKYFLLSQRIPALIIFRRFDIKFIQIFPRISKFGVLRYAY